ncbi:MAG TPA: hypothetical protein VGR57_05690, partial [Ktedonobacterales bacterium]|nr:hypothetical protein [Ktedonobacterales bacterium]
AASDAFIPPSDATLTALADALGLATSELAAAVMRRRACLEELAQGTGAGLAATRRAIETLMASESAAPAAPDSTDSESDPNT